MSKPKSTTTRFIRKARLRIKELSIKAEESEGKITAFEVIPVSGESKRFEVYRNQILTAFVKAQKYAEKFLPQPIKK